MRGFQNSLVHRPVALVSAAVMSVLLLGACGADGRPDSAAAAREARAAEKRPRTKAIEQPAVQGLDIAPSSRRVDLSMPTFSNPTRITNPLFPVSRQESVLLLGKVDGKSFRTEVTLLPDPRVIEWEGRRIPTLVSQYVAFLDGRIHEVAYDFYAQADDGSVWYFGEDVFNFRNGVIVDTHGTWLAGKDGPAAMIMPADPQVGDVYRPENIPGFVFEEVTVKAVDRSFEGPLHPIDGGLVIEELHMDGMTETKAFAPGYGEFLASGGGDVEALAVAVPADVASNPLPARLSALRRGWAAVFEAAGSDDWGTASAAVQRMRAAWDEYRTGEAPWRIEPRLTKALGALTKAVGARESLGARQSAIDGAQSILDLELRYRPAAEIDRARFDLWLAQLIVDATTGDANAVNGDFMALDYVRDRIVHSLDGSAVIELNTGLEKLQGAIGDRDLGGAATIAAQLRSGLRLDSR